MRLISTDIGILDLDNPQNVDTLKRVLPDQYADVVKTGEIKPATTAPAQAPAAPTPSPQLAAIQATKAAPAVYSIMGSQGSSMALPPPTNGGAQVGVQPVLDRAHRMQAGYPMGEDRNFSAPGGLAAQPQANPFQAVPVNRQPVMSAISRYNAGLQNTTPGWGAANYTLPNNTRQDAMRVENNGGAQVIAPGVQTPTPYNVFNNPTAPQSPQASQWGAFKGNGFSIGGAGGWGGW